MGDCCSNSPSQQTVAQQRSRTPLKEMQFKDNSEGETSKKTNSARRKSFILQHCYDASSVIADIFQVESTPNNEFKNIGLLGAADENNADDEEEDLSKYYYLDLDEERANIKCLLDEDTWLPSIDH